MPVQKSPPPEHTCQQSPGRSSQDSESLQVALKLLTKQKHPVSTGKGNDESSSLKGMRIYVNECVEICWSKRDLTCLKQYGGFMCPLKNNSRPVEEADRQDRCLKLEGRATA